MRMKVELREEELTDEDESRAERRGAELTDEDESRAQAESTTKLSDRRPGPSRSGDEGNN